MPEEQQQRPAGSKWRPRRPSPLGLMGPPESDVPRASGLPSPRAVGFMLAFIGAVLALVSLLTPGC